MRNPHLDPDKDQLPPEEQQYERALRPKALQDFSGQPKIVENLKIPLDFQKIIRIFS